MLFVICYRAHLRHLGMAMDNRGSINDKREIELFLVTAAADIPMKTRSALARCLFDPVGQQQFVSS